MFGTGPFGVTPFSATTAPTVIPEIPDVPVVGIDAAKVPAARRVTFQGGKRVVVFQGSKRKVVF